MMMALASAGPLPTILVPGGVTLLPESGEDAGKVQTIGARFAQQQITLQYAAEVGCRACASLAEHPLFFKKLIYEMRFDEVSAIYALFGQFFIGIRVQTEDLASWLNGKLTSTTPLHLCLAMITRSLTTIHERGYL